MIKLTYNPPIDAEGFHQLKVYDEDGKEHSYSWSDRVQRESEQNAQYVNIAPFAPMAKFLKDKFNETSN